MLVRVCTCLIVALSIVSTGCQTISWPKSNVFSQTPSNAADEFETPQSMAVIWKDSVLQGIGQSPTKGFGGRIFFYDKNGNPIKADGELIVYGFEDNSPKGASADHKYVFDAEKFQEKHYDETELGHSYSVWVPWEKLGGLRKQITLIPMFKTSSGRLIQAKPSNLALPGINPFGNLNVSNSPNRRYDSMSHSNSNRVQQASGVEQTNQVRHAAGTEKNKSMQTTTLTLPREMGRRLSSLPAQTFNTNRSNANLNSKDGSEDRFNRIYSSQSVRKPRVDPRLDLDARAAAAREQNKRSESTSDSSQPAVFGKPGSFR